MANLLHSEPCAMTFLCTVEKHSIRYVTEYVLHLNEMYTFQTQERPVLGFIHGSCIPQRASGHRWIIMITNPRR